jgi:uncharacterized membrane protein
MKTISKIGWWIFGIFSTVIGLYPLIYFLIDRRFGLLSSKTPELLQDIIWNTGFYGHIIFGGIALLTGWTQFSKKLRLNRVNLHRTLGKIYVASAMISGICGIYIGFYATGGLISSLGFILLGIVWLSSTLMAFDAVRKKKFDAHANMMLISFAACFAAVTLRIWLPLLTSLTGEFTIAYRIVAWLCWVPNILVALIYLYINRNEPSVNFK